MSTGLIYKIVNVTKNKVYIGSTTNFPGRIQSHLNTAKNNPNRSTFYLDLYSNPLNFTFGIVELNVPLLNLKFVESQWILKFISNTYNDVIKSGNELLHPEQVEEIRYYLSDSNLSYANISKFYDVSVSTISDINTGKTWYDSIYCYPIRNSTVKRKTLTIQDIEDIYTLLRNSEISFKDICDKYGWKSQSVIRKINNGTYKLSPLPCSSYPIRPVDSRKGKR